MRVVPRSAGCVVALALATGIGSVASAQEAGEPPELTQARELFREGSQFTQQGKWAEARDRYERALALKRAPITLYSLALAEMNTGLLTRALEHYKAFLAERPTGELRQYEQPAREAVVELDKRVARVSIVVQPEGVAGVHVTLDSDDVPAIALGQPRLVNPGSHTIAASAPGRKPARTYLTFDEGGSATVELVLDPAQTAPPPDAPPVAPTATAAPTPTREAPIASTAPPGRRSLTLPIALLGAGGVVLGTGVAIGLVGVGKASDAPRRDSDAGRSALAVATVGDVVAGAGIVTAGVGLVLLITRLRTPGPAPAPARSGFVSPVQGAGFQF